MTSLPTAGDTFPAAGQATPPDIATGPSADSTSCGSQFARIGTGHFTTKHFRDRTRSFPLFLFEKLARIHGVTLISVQKGHGVKPLHKVNQRFPIIDFGDSVDSGPAETKDTPAIMMSLDLVITPDTSLAHLAGALGVPVWIPISLIADFRWLLDRDDSPWYPSVRLFRRASTGGWDEVFERMAHALATRPLPPRPLKAHASVRNET